MIQVKATFACIRSGTAERAARVRVRVCTCDSCRSSYSKISGWRPVPKEEVGGARVALYHDCPLSIVGYDRSQHGVETGDYV
jgi:hypothetical protein